MNFLTSFVSSDKIIYMSNTHHPQEAKEMDANYDVVAKSWKQEVVFEGTSQKGLDWIRRHWLADTFCTYSLLNAAEHVKTMNTDGLSVALLCRV